MKKNNKNSNDLDSAVTDELVADLNEYAIGSVAQSFNYTWLDSFDMEDVEERRLYINGEIDDDVISSIGYQILRYNRLDKNLKEEDRVPILLYLNTDGGSLYSGNSLISIIKSSITPVHTVNLGRCFSMGFLIFIAGKERYTLDNGVFLLHDGSNGGFDSSAKMVDKIEFEKNVIERKIKEFVLENTAITAKTYDKNYRKEWYMDADKAKELDIADYIVGEDCTINDILN